MTVAGNGEELLRSQRTDDADSAESYSSRFADQYLHASTDRLVAHIRFPQKAKVTAMSDAPTAGNTCWSEVGSGSGCGSGCVSGGGHGRVHRR